MGRNISNSSQALTQKLEFFDALVVVYIVAFVREYFWILQNNTLAWILTILVSLAFGAIYVITKEPPEEKRPIVFWIIVALPLLFFYLIRFGYPDLSFDVLSYHIFHSERALRGMMRVPGDFAPAYFPYFNNPVADMITGMFRHLFGFRLGTFVNYLALLWTGTILFKLFRRDIRSAALLSLAVLLILLSEQLLSEINNYMVDLLALPLLLEATYLALREDDQTSRTTKYYICISLLLGMSIALKLTSLVFALPIGLIVLGKFLATRPHSLSRYVRITGTMAVAFFLPIVPHALCLFRLTGNPVFPLYNKLFKSPYWPDENISDGRWGPRGVWQTLLWPFEIVFRQERLSELHVYSGRMSLGLGAAILLVFLVRNQRARALGFITIVSAVLWSMGTGYIRYGLFLEVLSGISLIMLGVYLWRSSFNPQLLRQGLALLVWTGLLIQTAVGVYMFDREWGGRPTAFEHPREYRTELKELFRDRSLIRYLTPNEHDLFGGVGVWVETGPKTSAVTGMLKPDVPQLNLFAEALVGTPAAMREFRTALDTISARKMLAVVFEDDLEAALVRLKNRGFAALKTTHVQLPYYSWQRRLPLVVLEVAPDPLGRTLGIFSAEVSVLQCPTTIKVGQRTTVRVKVKNTSGAVWPANQNQSGLHQVTLGNKWLESGRIVINDDGRTPLPGDLAPGAEIQLELRIRAPEKTGMYTLMLDLVQEQVSWFYEKGSTPAEVSVTVER